MRNATEIGAQYGISARKLNKILNEEGIIFRTNSTWILYLKYQNMGYTGFKEFLYTDYTNNKLKSRSGIVWTQKGEELIEDVLRYRGILKIDELESLKKIFEEKTQKEFTDKVHNDIMNMCRDRGISCSGGVCSDCFNSTYPIAVNMTKR